MRSAITGSVGLVPKQMYSRFRPDVYTTPMNLGYCRERKAVTGFINKISGNYDFWIVGLISSIKVIYR